ncbi:EFR1 family ferrodoxin [Clostridium thermopalmarium]|uniref:Ferredoxin n=2 Tax=Clostridium TaxID=1485 RepID=A0A2T0AKM3_9CLOT|nr:EFR1 family ferrodoxin [Clostridium thermopalmarium]PRR69117.1 ferredoxin [Clostridium thermopalmarium DSM 5974]PVZ26532.1 4Fe-4S dicluster protein [Clostridium thermopalmarium DSM 5974]
MVLYFSGTGNTKYVAKLICDGLGDECIDLFDRIRNNDKSPLYSEKPYVICSPIYVCEMPLFLMKYLRSITFNGNNKVYFVFTSGGYCGSAKVQAKLFSIRKKLKCLGCVEFVMPRNYVANNKYSMDDEEVIRLKISNATKKVKEVVEDIKNGRRVKSRHVWLFEILIITPFAPLWTKYKLVAKDFYTTDACVGCRICEKVCPLNNIKVVDKKPKWGENCTHCMACISKCPKKAIEYGNITQGKKRYLLKDYVSAKRKD